MKRKLKVLAVLASMGYRVNSEGNVLTALFLRSDKKVFLKGVGTLRPSIFTENRKSVESGERWLSVLGRRGRCAKKERGAVTPAEFLIELRKWDKEVTETKVTVDRLRYLPRVKGRFRDLQRLVLSSGPSLGNSSSVVASPVTLGVSATG